MSDASPTPTLAADVLAAQALAKQHGVGTPNVLTTPLADTREKSRAYQEWLSQPAPPVGRVVEHRLDHLAVPATLRLYYPEGASDAPLPLYLHLHGGGFAHGDLDTLDRWKREIAAEAGIVTAGLSYALSPEARYPVALEQVLGALRWLRDQAPSLGLDATRLSVGGESAGGNLTLAALQRLRDEGDAFIKTGVVIYGMLSARRDTPSHESFGDGRFGLSTEKLDWFWNQYVGDAAQLTDPGVAPLHADVAGLPPLILQAAALDPLLDDTLDLANKLFATGPAPTFIVYSGVPHSFIGMTRILPQAQEARTDLVQALRRNLAA
ncbi:alpha/beta hydrolase [Achromobacter marplatensis]|jgi:acetyl esterase|uniref:Alpha/beta hydrolase n=2 Tax=Achromobacter marplatensis TaxID=470868 RepID=A0AA42W9Q4_9BURK|nr:alpha/beta hydrolase [Achromobacter marplatensis]EJO29880.1 acetyl esterase [Achromobacter marplatensis]MDH2050306.1 alpha/beta hydrolase [Achromobacter marplatensis]